MEPGSDIYGLDAAQVIPVLEAAVGALIARFTVQSRPSGGGSSGSNTCFCDFRFTTLQGKVGEETLFVKRCVWRPEAIHYQFLAAAVVPTPRLHGVCFNGKGEEIIFVERLPRIGFQTDSPEEWRHFLSLMARFNACEVTPDYTAHLFPYEPDGTWGDNRWITSLNANPSDEEIGASLRHCGVEDRELPALQSAARALFARIETHPKGLLHQDFFPDNLGWRGGEIVIMDLQKHALGPRFADGGPYLGLPDWSPTAAFLDARDTGRVSRREALTRHYLDEYARFGGGTVPLETFQEEARDLFWAHKIITLPSMLAAGKQARVREVLEFLRRPAID